MQSHLTDAVLPTSALAGKAIDFSDTADGPEKERGTFADDENEAGRAARPASMRETFQRLN